MLLKKQNPVKPTKQKNPQISTKKPTYTYLDTIRLWIVQDPQLCMSLPVAIKEWHFLLKTWRLFSMISSQVGIDNSPLFSNIGSCFLKQQCFWKTIFFLRCTEITLQQNKKKKTNSNMTVLFPIHINWFSLSFCNVGGCSYCSVALIFPEWLGNLLLSVTLTAITADLCASQYLNKRRMLSQMDTHREK